MGLYTLVAGVLKYFLIFGGFVRFDSDPILAFVMWCFCPFLLFSGLPTWSYDENVDCPHLYQLIMGLCTLIVEVLKYFLIFWGFVHFDSDPLGHFVLWCFCQFLLFSVHAHVIAWQECWLSTPVSCDHGIVHLDCWSIKIISHFWGFCLLWFWSYFGFRNVVLLSIFAFLWPPTWSHEENVDYPHLYHVIMGSYTLIVGVLKYFLIFGGFVRFDSDPFGLS